MNPLVTIYTPTSSNCSNWSYQNERLRSRSSLDQFHARQSKRAKPPTLAQGEK